MSVTRRTFLAQATLASAYAAIGQTTVPKTAYPTDPRHRIAIATYPFRARILSPSNTERLENVPGMDLPAFARFIRSEFNVFGIEPLHSHFASTDEAYVHKLKSAFDAVGIRTVNIPVDEDIDLASTDPGRRDASNRILERWINIANILRSPSIRIGTVPHGSGPADIAGAAAALKPLLSYAAAHNVIVCLENDDPVFGNAQRVVSILKQVSSPWLRALPDFGNALMGGDESFNAQSVRSMFRYAANIAHVKDAEVIDKVRRTASLKELFTIARQAGFLGYYSMESDSSADPVPDTHHLVEQALALM